MFRKIIRGVIFIGFSVQILLGLAWMACNFSSVQDFAEVSTGIYGGTVRLLGRAYPVMYVLQLLAAAAAGGRLVSRLCLYVGGRDQNRDKCLNGGRGQNRDKSLNGGRDQNRKKNRLYALWGSLALMTLPMAMQCHMALLPYSFVCSAGLLQLSFCCELLEPAGSFRHSRVFSHINFYERSEVLGHREIFDPVPFAGLWVCYFVQALLLPEYIFLGAVPVVLMLLFKSRGIAGAKMGLKVMVLLGVAAAVILAACSLDGKQGAENDISGMEWTLVKRLCWPTLWVDYERMPDEIQEATADAVWESTYYPGNMDRVFKPAIEAAMSAGEAKPLLAEAAACSWDIHGPMIIRQVGWDVLGYCASPVILQVQLSGGAYESHSGRNYEIMRRQAPVLTKLYVDYGSWWFAAAAVLTAVLLSARLAAGEKSCFRGKGRLFVVAICFAVCCISWYTLQGAGIMDYKYTVFINELWFLWSLYIQFQR